MPDSEQMRVAKIIEATLYYYDPKNEEETKGRGFQPDRWLKILNNPKSSRIQQLKALNALNSLEPGIPDPTEDFIQVAKEWGDKQNPPIGGKAWREMHIPWDVIRKCGYKVKGRKPGVKDGQGQSPITIAQRKRKTAKVSDAKENRA